MIKVHFIHGFLGFPSDWDSFKEDMNEYNYKFHSISDYMSPHSNNENSKFVLWAMKFNSSVFKEPIKNKNILIGYSLGGRLALHALIQSNKWDAAIIVSANPGLSHEAEKQARIANDIAWANRFLNEKWENVMESWNSQGVFSNMKNILTRDEKQFNKNEVASMLTDFSLGKQENLREKIKSLHIPILWLAGDKDSKFANVTMEMKELINTIEIKIIADAGHRIPWEKPKEFKEVCFNFINKNLIK
ncbi:alpha/beta fold hydrolase [Silvanigrella aquatica]|uniref:AB hydrolase-1 domain-containing protein n=1 Tax=Silvanigrella aquatica TaxID=1915309 RepID=A0A1L4CX66_9BACT|nr:alpha/beta fold hydrolase [Silvanigrella aquatica]APJ02538.1 hypothetical protein AXG55_00745 [Silvanigrella aquatica]